MYTHIDRASFATGCNQSAHTNWVKHQTGSIMNFRTNKNRIRKSKLKLIDVECLP